MAQFATVFVPFALQAANTAWQQYQQYEVYDRQRQERALAGQAQAEAARARANAAATHTAETAALRNDAAWSAHDREAGTIAQQTDAAIAALNRDFARTELGRAEALRHTVSGERARFAGQGLDPAYGSAGAVLRGIGSLAADQTRRAREALTHEQAQLQQSAAADIAAGWRETADQTTTRTQQANLDIWNRQVDLNTQLHQLGVQQSAAERRDLLDLTLSNQRAALGLVNTGLGAAAHGLGGY